LANYRIALFSASLRAGGSERTTINLAAGFKERGHTVTVILAKAEGEFLSDLPAGTPVHDLEHARVIQSLPRLIRALRVEQPEILLSTQTHCNLVALWAAKLAQVRTKVVLKETSTMSLSTTQSGWKERLLPILARIFYPLADGLVANSLSAADDLARTVHIRREKITIIYNPTVSSSLLIKAGEQPTDPWLKPGSPPVILAAGRLTAAKDFPTLIRAFAKLHLHQNAHLIILGEGEDRLKLEEQIRKLGLDQEVQLPGYVPNPYAYMAHAAVFVLSSVWEGFPNVLVEALACGCPVVATNCMSGPEEILEQGHFGALVPVGNDEQLSAAIVNSIRFPLDRKVLQERGELFSMARAADSYLTLFESLLARKPENSAAL
jgi:glycosyltransferase involved in cell wall biosynthesis